MSPVWIVLAFLPMLGGAERFNCRGRILGAYYADVKSGCKAFHVCVRVAGGGIRDFRFFCPPGTLFHQEAQTCTDWGDDDPLACPADIYDGQFDLYKIGSGFDTKKVSSPVNREEEPEFSLQRAETGDRRNSQNGAQAGGGASDLRAAHSSDFFSGQRDRGRDEPSAQAAAAPASPHRQSFRRATTPRSVPSTTQYTTVPSFPPPQPTNPPQYEINKRKIIRKRPVYTPTTSAATTYAPNTTPEKSYTGPPQQNFNRRNQFQNRNYFNPTTANVPPQYREEYVEVSKVTPKQNRFFPNSPTPTPFSHSTSAPQVTKKEGLVEIYNYDAQSTPGFQAQNENHPFKVRNSFNVVPDAPAVSDFVKTKSINQNYNGRGTPTTAIDYNSSRGIVTSTPAYRNFNSVSYEPEKNNFAQFAGAKQSYYSNNDSPTTFPTSTTYATTPSNPSSNFNTAAYNTNLAFNTQSANYAESDEDDGQYRPPQGEDDGQYRPELYEREKELLSGAHSLNIAASGNRLPEEQKLQGKQLSQKSNSKSAAVPRPFRPAPTPFSVSTQPPPDVYSTTVRPQTEPPNTQRTFDYFQTYTTTSRPYEPPSEPATTSYAQVNNPAVRITTILPPRNLEQRIPNYETVPPTTASTPPPRPPSRPPHYANSAKKKEDSSYDYAYYDSDPGFSEYDHIEEFGRTKSRV